MNRVKVGFFSLSGRGGSDDDTHDDPDDRAYLAWHQLDHMPEQYQLPGIVHGQRWVSNEACHAARSAASGVFEDVHHVVLYLMGDPVEQTLDDFFDLGSRLAHLGRFPRDLPRRFLGALRLLDARAAPRVLVSAEVVPFRPNRGIYLIAERPADPGRLDRYLRWRQGEHLDRLVTTPGVAGAWVFATAARHRRGRYTDGDFRITVCYLDGDPGEAGSALGPLMEEAWRDAPVTPLLAAPFASLVPWVWPEGVYQSYD
ncbi:MAG TPA: hypothetical protein VKD21_02360 [Acidimicrobiales bacterium]|nr:hypothetical protein [Acidimicrobiales bacterium]